MPLKKEFPSIQINETEYLKEIKIGKSKDLSKHQIIFEMWKNENFKIDNGESQTECFDKMKPFLDKVFSEFKDKKKYNISNSWKSNWYNNKALFWIKL